MRLHRLRREQFVTAGRDEAHCALPPGPVGELAHIVAVRSCPGRVFDHRAAALAEPFGSP